MSVATQSQEQRTRHSLHAFAGLQILAALRDSTGDTTIPVQQLMTLLAVYLYPDMPLTDLPQYSGVERSANSRNIAKLGVGERPTKPGPGWLEAYHDPMDRRYVRLRLTPRGRAVIETAMQACAPTVERAFARTH